MRSHAKASSVGSNSGWSARLGSIGVLSLLLACLLSASAFAAETRVPVETIGPITGPELGEPGQPGPGAIAVDQGTNDVYVAQYNGFPGHAKIKRFDENGAPANFSALGSNEITGRSLISGEALNEIAVDSSSHDFYVAEWGGPGAIRAFQQNGEPHEFTAGPGAGTNKLPGFSELCGVAVDSNGDIYMGDYSTGVHVYASDGEEITSFPASEACNVAVDSSGDVYVARYVFGEPGVAKFTPSQFPVTSSTTYASAGDVTGAKAYALSVDPASDDLYVDLSNRILVYDSSGALRYEFGTGIGSSEGVAVDNSNEKAYAGDVITLMVQVYGPPVSLPDAKTEGATEVRAETALLHGTVGAAGGPSTTCEFQYTTKAKFQSEGFTGASAVPCSPAGPFTGESQSAVTGEATGLTPGVDYRFRLTGTNSLGTSFGTVGIFHTPASAPLIESVSVEGVGTDNADLSATIKPRGGVTSYRVEFGTSAAYGQSSESAPIGFEGDESPHTVSVHVAGLTPGTAYHFRFVATNGAGTTNGADTPFATYTTPPSFAPCSNDQFRTGFGERLPDCRAYEQATPTDKNGADIQGSEGLVQASANGDRVTFYLLGGLPTSGGSSRLAAFMASRGPGGWSSDGLLPLREAGEEAETRGWSEDLSTTLIFAGKTLYLRDSATASFEPALTGLRDVRVAGFAADRRHLAFQTFAALLPEVSEVGADILYDLDHGELTSVGRIPAGSGTSCDDEAGPACIVSPTGSYAGSNENAPDNVAQNTISRDGSKVFFSTRGEHKIYVREDGERTTWISASQRTTPDPNGIKPATFQAITPDGSKVFFTSCEKLTDDSTAVSPAGSGCGAKGNSEFGTGLDLYAYDTGSGQLTDLSVDSNVGDAKGADVVGVLGASSDGSYVYFAANGVLAPGGSAGNCVSASIPSSGACNLYLVHDGAVTFVAPLDQGGSGTSGDEFNWSYFNFSVAKTSRVADDGTLLFRSTNSLTGYDNVGSELGDCGVRIGNPQIVVEPCPELFRYVPTTEGLTCVSCNPAGLSPPKGNAPSLVSKHADGLFDPPHGIPFLTRNLSANGKRVFFETADALLPSDTNGNSGCPILSGGNGACKDVYEWEAKGEGSCESESQNGGCLYLISSGKSPDPSYFLDASSNGDHVFLFTHQQLVPGDKDQLNDIYDASAGGGLAAQHTLTPPTCDTSACVANPPPPAPQSLASASFSGPGNARPIPAKSRCPKGKRKVRRAGKARCVPRHSQKKQHKRANTNRGGSK